MTRYFEATLCNLWFKNLITASGIVEVKSMGLRMATGKCQVIVAKEFDDSPMLTILEFGPRRSLKWIIEYQSSRFQKPNHHVHSSHLRDIKPLDFNIPV